MLEQFFYTPINYIIKFVKQYYYQTYSQLISSILCQKNWHWSPFLDKKVIEVVAVGCYKLTWDLRIIINKIN